MKRGSVKIVAGICRDSKAYTSRNKRMSECFVVEIDIKKTLMYYVPFFDQYL